jgi:hypothetical protein
VGLTELLQFVGVTGSKKPSRNLVPSGLSWYLCFIIPPVYAKNNPKPGDVSEYSQEESFRRLIKEEVDAQIKASQIESEKPGKKWKNAWRSASPITKAGVQISAFVMVATLANAVAAIIQSCNTSAQLSEMQKSTIASENAAYAACLSAKISRKTLMENPYRDTKRGHGCS